MKALQPKTSFTIIVPALLLVMALPGCSFIEDRQDDIVPIVDAAPAQRVEYKGATPSKTAKPQATYTYTVRSGDTLGTIAQEYLGNSSRYTELLELNQLKPSDAIYTGQRLKLPTEGLQVPDTLNNNNLQPSKANVQTSRYPELETLLNQEQYSQAIQWIIKQNELANNAALQTTLVNTAQKQVDIYHRQQKVAKAEALLSDLLSNTPMTSHNKSTLQTELSKLRAEQDLITAKRFADSAQYDQSYPILLNAWKTIGQPLEQNILFTGARNKVSEDYHQKALRLYRNQELNKALSFWEKILAINPNDDLALVYQDRVKALQNKLENL